jgi:plasmid stabilization system protein ParE
MRAVVYSITFNDQLNAMFGYSDQHFGAMQTDQMKQRLYAKVDTFLALFPAAKQPDPELGLTLYPIHGTPFVVAYDFDDDELRMHFVFHKSTDTTAIDPGGAVWS